MKNGETSSRRKGSTCGDRREDIKGKWRDGCEEVRAGKDAREGRFREMLRSYEFGFKESHRGEDHPKADSHEEPRSTKTDIRNQDSQEFESLARRCVRACVRRSRERIHSARTLHESDSQRTHQATQATHGIRGAMLHRADYQRTEVLACSQGDPP